MSKKEQKKYVITSAQYGTKINKDFLESLEKYSEQNNVDDILILPIKGRYKADTNLDDLVEQYYVVLGDYNLNKKIHIKDYKIRPQQIDPVTGLGRFAQSDVSTIFASPKQRLKVVPNSTNKLPKVLMTTGALSEPNYNNNRMGRIATEDHKYGALIVETDGDNLYHYRQLDSLVNGKFADLGKMYQKNKVYDVRPEALILGDWHSGDTDKKSKKASLEMIVDYQPKNIILHDVFNGHSINYHDRKKKLYRAQDYSKHKLSLEKELNLVSKELKEITRRSPRDSKVVVVKSNHDEFLDNYLQSGDFLEDPQNSKLASKIFGDVLDGKDALKSGLSYFMDLPDNLIFLNRDEDYKIRGWQLGSHGDLGANGGRGSMRSKEQAYGKSVTGHSHVPEILRDTYVVGTNSKLKLRYNRGLSSWLHTNAFLYENGKVQLVNMIGGKYKT